MATGVYSVKTLNDNWVEDRLQPAGSLSVTGDVDKKVVRALEPDLAYIGERYDVLARVSRIPRRPSYAVPDDGFREILSTNLHDLRHPSSHPGFAKRQSSCPCLTNTANAPVSPPELRPLDGPPSGFGASLQQHPKNHEQRFWNTSHGDTYGYNELGRSKSMKLCPTTKHPSGVTSESVEKRVTGMQCGQLCGEKFSEHIDPGRDTRTQRAWLPGGDAGLRNVHLGGKKPRAPPIDNELSLPLGEGAMAKVRQDLKERQGRLSRIATHITRGAHMKSGISLFQDE